MSDKDLFEGETPSQEELEEARRFAEALEAGKSGPDTVDGMPVARLLEALGERGGSDEIRGARLRRELVMSASQKKRRSAWVWRAAAAALLTAGLAASYLWLRPGRPDETLLAQREREARAAVEAVVSGSGIDANTERLRLEFDRQAQERLASANRAERFESDGGEGSVSAPSQKDERSRLAPSNSTVNPAFVDFATSTGQPLMGAERPPSVILRVLRSNANEESCHAYGCFNNEILPECSIEGVVRMTTMRPLAEQCQMRYSGCMAGNAVELSASGVEQPFTGREDQPLPARTENFGGIS